jgi:hypothetical protein
MDGRKITALNNPRMSAVTKRNHSMALVNNSRGQISIFFSASLIVLITIVAFVINIGLFVKAKINLQNATDAAAFSGAAVQARQLSTIGYLNWEMRNIFKEWMYKYYVVGNLNINDVENGTGNPAMSFRLQPDNNVLATGARASTEDHYNIPAVCIHVEGSKTNICRRYAIPGLPEFGPSNLPGAEEASRAFMDALIGNKIDDCITRTRLNMLVASTWAYNVLSTDAIDATLVGRGPAILANRQGAWPKALEVAMRIRNLELAVNRQALTQGVCAGGSGSTSKTSCGAGIDSISQEKRLGNERIVKAFYSGYRNLGNMVDREMKDTFTLTEIPPKAVKLGTETSNSYFLIPQAAIQNYEKQYLDLKLQMVNYAVFYAAMIPRAEGDLSGACDISKVAIPVPGYPLGYYKNPDLLTYYAVRGEAEFVGMFNPFVKNGNIKLTAYAAAKPFGGRIGPMLFTQRENQDFLTGRNDQGKKRSVPYMASLDFVGTQIRSTTGGPGGTLSLGEFAAGVPLPINFPGSDGHFWLEGPDKPVGGKVNDGTIQFGIPNMVYDYQEPFTSTGYSLQSEPIHMIHTSQPQSGDQPVGLFSSEQFKMFKGTRIGTELTTQDLMEDEIGRVRAPTLYETANYLIPTPGEYNKSQQLDSFGFIPGAPVKQIAGGVKQYQAFVYAPLYSADQFDVFWKTNQDVVNTIFEFMRAQRSGIDKYRRNLNRGAREVYNMGTRVAGPAAGSAPAYRRSAAGISDIDFTNTDDNQKVGSCNSIAGSFLYFYYGAGNLFPNDYVANPAGCPVPLGDQLVTYFSQTGSSNNFSGTHYFMDYFWKEDNFPRSPQSTKSWAALSAYFPGRLTGVDESGHLTNPLLGEQLELMRRNFYSTKFVALDSLQNGGGYSEDQTGFVIYSEGDTATENGSERSQTSFKNSLDASSLGLDLSNIKY